MKNLILIAASLLTFNQIKAQSNWSFGAELFPNLTTGVIKNTGTYDPYLVQTIQDREISKFCLSGQLFATYRLTTRSSLQMGIGYQNTGEKTTFMPTIYGDMIDPRRGFVYQSTSDPNAIRGLRYFYNHHNIQVPILFQYNLTNRFYLKSGLSTIVNLSNTVTVEKHMLSGSKERHTDNYNSTNFRSINFSAQFGVGFDYVQTNNFSLYVQPTIEKFLIGVYKNPSINRVPLSMGLVFGVRI